jgi:hypothetical protein
VTLIVVHSRIRHATARIVKRPSIYRELKRQHVIRLCCPVAAIEPVMKLSRKAGSRTASVL